MSREDKHHAMGTESSLRIATLRSELVHFMPDWLPHSLRRAGTTTLELEIDRQGRESWGLLEVVFVQPRLERLAIRRRAAVVRRRRVQRLTRHGPMLGSGRLGADDIREARMLALAGLTKVLVVAEARIHAESLAQALESRGFAASFALPADPALCAASSAADVVLVDARRGNSLHLVGELAGSPAARVVVIEPPEGGDAHALACAEAGAIGTVPSSGSVDRLAEVLSSAADGDAVFAPVVVAQLARRVAALTAARRTSALPSGITRRELQVLELLEAGLSNKEIAARLNVELQTVKNHVHSILRKLHVQRRSQAAAAFRAVGGFGGGEVPLGYYARA
jgi:two-component system nitrate/nitrite response regulator NarL